MLFSRIEAVNQGFFGGPVTERNLERVGDLIAVAQGQMILVEPEREELQLSMVGHHGGITAAEIEIPLLVHQK